MPALAIALRSFSARLKSRGSILPLGAGKSSCTFAWRRACSRCGLSSEWIRIASRGRPKGTRATMSGARRPGCARQIHVCPFKSGELALAQACVDGRCVERTPERLDLEQRRDDLVRFEEGWLALRLLPPAGALSGVRGSPLLHADRRGKDAVHEPAH